MTPRGCLFAVLLAVAFWTVVVLGVVVVRRSS